jgi:hypothetical protein
MKLKLYFFTISIDKSADVYECTQYIHIGLRSTPGVILVHPSPSAVTT